MKRIAGAACCAGIVASVQATVKYGAAIFHDTRRITNKRMERGAERFDVAVVLVKYEVFRCEYGLAAHIIGIHPLPAAGQRAAVEYHVDAIVGGIAEYIFIQAHGLLLVAAEEVYFNCFDANVFKPLHLLFSYYRSVHKAGRSLYYVVPVAA